MKKISIIFIFLLIAMGLFFLPEVQAESWEGTSWGKQQVSTIIDNTNDENISLAIRQKGSEDFGFYEFEGNGTSNKKEPTIQHTQKVNYIFSKEADIEILLVIHQTNLKDDYSLNVTYGETSIVKSFDKHTKKIGRLIIATTLNGLKSGQNKNICLKMLGNMGQNKSMGLDFKINLQIDVVDKNVNQETGKLNIDDIYNVINAHGDVRVVVGQGDIVLHNELYLDAINHEGNMNEIDIQINDYTFAVGQPITIGIGANSNGLISSNIEWGTDFVDLLHGGSYASKLCGNSNLLISKVHFSFPITGTKTVKLRYETDASPSSNDAGRYIKFTIKLTFNVGDFAQSHTPLDESNITRLAKFAEEKLGNGDTMLLIKSGNQYYYWIYGGIDAKDSTDTNRVILPVDASGFKFRAYQMCEIYIFFEKSYMVNDSAGIDRSRQWM